MNRGVSMFYDHLQDRWSVELNGRHYGLHCGECFDLIAGTHAIPCRLEMDEEWFIVIKGVRMNLRTQDIYTINI